MPSIDRLVRVARAAMEVPVVLLSLVDVHRQFFASQCGLGEPWASKRETPLSHSFCQHVVASNEPLVVSDARNDSRVSENLAIRDLNVIAYAGMPVRVPGEETVLGSFCAIDDKPREWTERQLAILGDLALVVSSEIHHRRKSWRAESSNDELRRVISRLEKTRVNSTKTARDVEHDIRTPLGIIATAVATLKIHDSLQDQEVLQLLDLLERNARHAASIAGELNPRARPAPGGRRVDLGDLVEELCADGRCRRPDLAIDVGHLPGLYVEASASDVQRCFENIFCNACRFAETRISVHVVSRSGSVSVSVDDDGPGLPNADDYDAAWQRATCFHRDTGLSQTGLGLSIVRELVHKNGGQVFARPSTFGGACFGFSLPEAPRSGEPRRPAE